MRSSDEQGPDFVHQWWIVAFIDLLGQQEAFLKTDVMPDGDDAEAHAALVAALKDSLGVTRGFHRFADAFRDGPSEELVPDSPLATLGPEQQATAKEWRRRELRQLNWSDGVVFYATLDRSPSHFPLRAVEDIVAACAFMAFAQLGMGKPIRGGIDVGTGIEADGQLFGAAVVKAYQLESKHAGHPRVLVGERLVHYLEAMAGQAPTDPTTSFEVTRARRIAEMLCRDQDGRWMVHFLGAWLRRRVGTPDVISMFRGADEFVSGSLRRHRTEGNADLAARYAQLTRYFDLHRSDWASAT